MAGRAGWSLSDLADACIAGGARWLQLRAKEMPGGALLDVASRLQQIAHAAGALLTVNDRADVTRLAGAGGVHVGQEDLPPWAARAIVGPDVVLGYSTHTPEQVDRGVGQPVDYIAIGPIFGTATKDTGYTAVGLDMVRYAAAAVARASASADLTIRQPRAVVAIGGITVENAADVIRAGAQSVAVISDLVLTGDPRARVREYLARLPTVGRV